MVVGESCVGRRGVTVMLCVETACGRAGVGRRIVAAAGVGPGSAFDTRRRGARCVSVVSAGQVPARVLATSWRSAETVGDSAAMRMSAKPKTVTIAMLGQWMLVRGIPRLLLTMIAVMMIVMSARIAAVTA